MLAYFEMTPGWRELLKPTVRGTQAVSASPDSSPIPFILSLIMASLFDRQTRK